MKKTEGRTSWTFEQVYENEKQPVEEIKEIKQHEKQKSDIS